MRDLLVIVLLRIMLVVKVVGGVMGCRSVMMVQVLLRLLRVHVRSGHHGNCRPVEGGWTQHPVVGLMVLVLMVERLVG